MKTATERCRIIWSRISQSPTQVPVRVAIPHGHIDQGNDGQPFSPNAHYFQVRINELYLAHNRQWFSVFDPMVFVVSEFEYDKKFETVPFIVGPGMMKQYETAAPAGMIFSNTRVAGLHPYRGGRLNLSVILYRVQRMNYAQQLLQLVEGVATALDFATVLSNYVKIAHVVLDGVESLLGLAGTTPIVGLRSEFDPDAGDHLEPTYFALVDMLDSQLDRNALWVRNNQLFYGRSLDSATPFRHADFVLYSIAQTSERGDVTMLPFYPLYEQVTQDAMKADDVSWKSAKANMTALAQKMVLSPDLTLAQANKLSEHYVVEMVRRHKQAVDWSTLGPAKATSAVDKKLLEAVKILDL